MKVLSTHEQLTLQVAASHALRALHAAAPDNLEAKAAAAYVAAEVSPTYDETAAYARENGLPVPDRELHAAAFRSLAELAAFVVLTPETQH